MSNAQAKLTELESLKDHEVAVSVAETDKIRSENQALMDAATAQHEQTLEFQGMLKKCMDKCKGFEQDADEKSKMVCDTRQASACLLSPMWNTLG